MGQVRELVRNGESGQATVEAVIVIPLAFVFLTALTYLAFLAGTVEMLSIEADHCAWNVDVAELMDAQGDQAEMDRIMQDAITSQPVLACKGLMSCEVHGVSVSTSSSSIYSPLKESTAEAIDIEGIRDGGQVATVDFYVDFTSTLPFAELIGAGTGTTTSRHYSKELTVKRRWSFE